MIVHVETAARVLAIGEWRVACRIGRGGGCDANSKHEGDGCTPRGLWPLRAVLLRPGGGLCDVRPRLPWRWLRPSDGWSDDPADPAYNRAVRHPHLFSAERLWRDDALYDAIVVLGHNDAPVVPGAGSAIFLHLSRGTPTEGCVAIARGDMAALLALVAPGWILEIA